MAPLCRQAVSRKKASRVCLSVNAGSELRQRNDSPTAINCFLEQTVCEPLAVHGFAKVTPAFSRTLFGVTLKVYRTRGMLGGTEQGA